jgi:hypothetical protein
MDRHQASSPGELFREGDYMKAILAGATMLALATTTPASALTLGCPDR